MPDGEMLTDIDGRMLAQGFPDSIASLAKDAGAAISALLHSKQWTERFSVKVEDQTILVPVRLHFASEGLRLSPADPAWLLARALQMRSTNGFERQRAVRDLMKDVRPWSAPYVMALIGEYVVEILDEIEAALTADAEKILGAFLLGNPAYWETTKRRVTSYWNAYYRFSPQTERRRRRTPDDYVGFRLVDRLERAVYRVGRMVG